MVTEVHLAGPGAIGDVCARDAPVAASAGGDPPHVRQAAVLDHVVPVVQVHGRAAVPGDELDLVADAQALRLPLQRDLAILLGEVEPRGAGRQDGGVAELRGEALSPASTIALLGCGRRSAVAIRHAGTSWGWTNPPIAGRRPAAAPVE